MRETDARKKLLSFEYFGYLLEVSKKKEKEEEMQNDKVAEQTK